MGLDMTLYSMDKHIEFNEDYTNEDYWYKHATKICDWRKFNALHKWFVDNVQNGVDECIPHVVSEDQLYSVIELLIDVYKTKDPSKLPPQPGFFFGSTDINLYYWKNVKNAAVDLFKIYMRTDWNNEQLVYSSSW